MAIFTSSFAIFAKQKYSANTQQIGLVMTAIGVTNFIFRGLLIPKLIDLFKERHLERMGVSLMLIGLITSLFAAQFLHQFPLVVIFAVGAGLNYPLMMGDISRSVNENEQGAIIGVANSLDSLAHIIGPIVGGLALSGKNPNTFLLASAASLCICLYLIFRERKPY